MDGVLRSVEQLACAKFSCIDVWRRWSSSCSVGRARCCSMQMSGEEVGRKRVVIVGGTGRVGGSTARALAAVLPNLQLVIAGRNREKGEALVAELGERAQYSAVDIEDESSLQSAFEDADLVVHAAGPFQRREKCSVLDIAIKSKAAYLDVCDDLQYSKEAKKLHDKAVQSNVPAVVSAGIYPGLSNIMAAELVRLAAAGSTDVSVSKPHRLRFSYFTAGSGGIGPTILATSFLLLGEEVVAYSRGEQVARKPYSSRLLVDFGKGIGKRNVYLLNLPEVTSAFEVLGVPTVSARFGTAPEFWNWAMAAVAKLVPQDFLADRKKVETLVHLSDPLVRFVDGIVGERVSVRVDLECTDGRKAVGIYSHKKLSESVGVATSAFARAVLEGSTQAGVWFPEEDGALDVPSRQRLLDRASEGAFNFAMNKSPWMIESDPKEIGFGIYMQ